MDPEAYSGVTCASVFKSGEGSECAKIKVTGFSLVEQATITEDSSARDVHDSDRADEFCACRIRTARSRCPRCARGRSWRDAGREGFQNGGCVPRTVPVAKLCTSGACGHTKDLFFSPMRPWRGQESTECFFEFDDRWRCSRCLVVWVCEKLAGQPGATQGSRTQESERKRPKSMGVPFRWDKRRPCTVVLLALWCAPPVCPTPLVAPVSNPLRKAGGCQFPCLPHRRNSLDLIRGRQRPQTVFCKGLRCFLQEVAVVACTKFQTVWVDVMRGARRFTSVPFPVLVTLLWRPWQTILMMPTRVPSLTQALSKTRESNSPSPDCLRRPHCGRWPCGCAHLSWSKCDAAPHQQEG